MIRTLGTVTTVQSHDGGLRLSVDVVRLDPVPTPGDSIAVNGVCLTVAARRDRMFEFDIIPETLSRSNLGSLVVGAAVNVEPSLRLGDSLDGHLVYGHVDATTAIERVDDEGQGARMWCRTPTIVAPLICLKGYVALEGVSLTVAAVEEGRFAVALIPETLKRTSLGRKRPGDLLNIEADPVARYVASVLGNRS